MSTAVDRRSSPAVIAAWVDFDPGAADEISGAPTNLLADVFALYLKTKGFHWHISERHFYDDHLMLDEQADQIFAMTDAIAERVRKIDGRTISSIGEVSRLRRLMDTHAGELSPKDMLAFTMTTCGSTGLCVRPMSCVKGTKMLHPQVS
jgi:starvation-inducible DNA-binding protein